MNQQQLNSLQQELRDMQESAKVLETMLSEFALGWSNDPEAVAQLSSTRALLVRTLVEELCFHAQELTRRATSSGHKTNG